MSSNNRKVNKFYYFYVMKFSRVPRINTLLQHVTAWMTLINIMLNERSQAQKRIHCMIPFHLPLGSIAVKTNGVRSKNSH